MLRPIAESRRLSDSEFQVDGPATAKHRGGEDHNSCFMKTSIIDQHDELELYSVGDIEPVEFIVAVAATSHYRTSECC